MLNGKMEKKLGEVIDEQDALKAAERAQWQEDMEAKTQVFTDDEDGYTCPLTPLRTATGSAGHPHRLDPPVGCLARRFNF